MNYAGAVQSNVYYTASITSAVIPQLPQPITIPEDPRNIPTPPMMFGLPMVGQSQLYTSFNPNYYQFQPVPIQEFPPPALYPSYNSAAVPSCSIDFSQALHFTTCAPTAATLDNTSYSAADWSAMSALSNLSSSDSWTDNSAISALSDPSSSDSLIDSSLTNVWSGEDVISDDEDSFASLETSQLFAGTFVPSYRGASPVLLYLIPCTDLCYVYNRIRSADGSKGSYVCRECYLKKKYVPAKVVNQNYFIKDPLSGGHICRPKSFSKEVVARRSIWRRSHRNHSANDSGISNST